MRVTLSRGLDSLETLTIAADGAPTELALVLDSNGPRAVIERGLELGPCVAVDRSPSRAAVRARVLALGQCACSGAHEPQ